ncbi:MAG: heme NO-binding domain-containing protein [Planctomycetales bacterium]|nr:heme NO-binding domain-containing protein [Planctomycetales bacterium]
MKGVVITEFLELVENRFGMGMADRVICKGGCPFHLGYTSVGTYDYQELIDMVRALSNETEIPVPHLIKDFGKHLFHQFRQSTPHYFETVSSTYELMTQVEEIIHVEVLRYTPEAELPRFEFPESEPNTKTIVYRSTRPLADLAEGLLLASIEFFEEQLTLHRVDHAGVPGTHATFQLVSTAP